MKKFLFLLCFVIPLFCMTQNLAREYEYDASGNRTICRVITLNPISPVPIDSTQLETVETEVFNTLTPLSPECFVEKIAQVEIKIYPNPATEVVTLEISQWQTLQNSSFKLYSLGGQLLQEQTVFSSATELSLSGLAKGIYILKVQINEYSEDWKIIKN